MKRLLEKLLRGQGRRAERERRLSFAKKLRILDQLMMEGELRVEDASRE
jgi:hypothetical protein